MKKRVDLAELFPKYLFWDADMSKLHIEKDKGLIIPRVLFDTDEENFESKIVILESLYSRETILEVLRSTRELIKNDVCELVAKRYNVEPFYRFKYKNIDLINLFPKYLFWDADMSKLRIERDKGLIIPRALFDTGEDNFETDIAKLETLYPRGTILEILQNTKELISDEVCLLVAKRYNVEPFYRYKHARRH